MSELKEHLDTRYVNKREGKEITLPQKYGNGYNPLVLPYTYQNISEDLVRSNENAIEAEIARGLTGHNGLNALNRLRTTSQEFVDDDLKRTFQYDIFKNYEQNFIDNYGGGNWDLTKNPNISSGSITGAGYSVIGDSILYPQVNLFWNSFYQKYFAVWYTPIRASNNSIISKASAESYIRNNLSKTSSYIQNDTEGIILRVSRELGFTPADVLSVNTQEPTQQVINALENIKSWCNLLDEAQKKYFLLKNTCDSVELNKYLFIDEDVNIFSTRQSTYFVFNVTEGYYDDLVEYSGLNKIPEPWSATKDYEAGDYVLGNSNDGEMKANYIYRCELGYKAKDNDGLFHLKTTKMEKFSNSQIAREITVDRWKIVNTDYAKELEALALIGVNPNNCVRVVLPTLEDKAPIDYYPNGLPRPNRQHGVVDWGEPGITLRPIVHKWIKNQEEIDNTPDGQEPPKPKYGTYINYKSILDEGEEDIPTDEVFLTTAEDFKASNKMSSPSNGGVTFIDTSRKLIRYYKKGLSKKYVSVKLEVKLKNIRRESFVNRQDLVKVVCRSAMTGIGYKAFYNCNNLKQALLPKGLLSIGEQAFAACISLRRASIPPGVSQLSECYIGCTNLQSIVLSDNIETLGDSTFMNCTSLEYVYNIKKLKKVGSNTFNNCQSLKEITLPAAITELPSRLFKNCKNAKITLLNNEPTFLGESCFEGCEKITEAVSFANLQQLNPATYKGCTNLKQITFNLSQENEKRDIPEKFCYGCTQLKSVDLQNVTSLGNKSFQNCASLTQVSIPSTVVEVGSEVFYDCFRLGKVIIPTSYSLGGSWIEGIINSINRNNWVDPVFTKVVLGNPNGRVVKWQLTTI